MERFNSFLPLAITLCFSFSAHSQDPGRFNAEIEQLARKRDSLQVEAPVLFVGSSTIRMWQWLAEDFPGTPVLNMGFGGSQMSDLLHFAELLVVPVRPSKIFIYEGDNDIAAGKSACHIMRDTRRLLRLLDEKLPAVPIVLISAKPSPSRWGLQKKYERLNRRLDKLSRRRDELSFANTWAVMLDGEGKPRPDIFLPDMLHMNRKGYELWAEALRPFL